MDNRARGYRLIMALLLTVCMLGCAAGALAAADPIRVSSLSEPQSVISEQEVDITIKVYNSSQEDVESDVILYNPLGNPVETYKGLKGENSVTYTGKWNVTKDEIEAGKIKFYIKYMVETEDGPKENLRTVPVTIQTEAAVPQLTATYSVSPTAAREGQSVTLSYMLSNTGNVELRNIVIENDGVTKKDVTAASLSVGEKITLEDTVVMGKEEMISKPQVTYQAAGSSKKLTISDMARKTITVAEDGLEVEIEADETKNVYPGEEIEFKLAMKNSGNTAYTDLSVQLSDGTAVADGVELAPGASYSNTFTMSFTEGKTVSVNVSGRDDAGNPVSMSSNELSVTTQSLSRALILDVTAGVQETVIHSEPAVLRFAVQVKNIGETDATTLTVRQNKTTVATIPSLPSGESRTLVFDLETSIAGQFRFDVSGKDAAGVEKTYSSNVLQVTYVAPTPAPTSTPAPTRVPPTPTPVPTATPVPSLGEIIASKVNPVVLYTVAGVLGALLAIVLGVSAVQNAKYKKRMAGAIDTIELSPDVRNHRGVDRKKHAARKTADKPAKPVRSGEQPIVPAQELESDQPAPAETASPARDALRQAEAEETRRRRAPVQVPTDKTLRVAPVEERPEFVAQGKVDDSQTRIFGKLPTDGEEQKGAEEAKAEPTAGAEAVKDPAVQGDTVRFDRQTINEVNRREEAARGKKRSEIKPMKKKRGLFGKRKAEDDDLIDGDDDLDGGEDDFFE